MVAAGLPDWLAGAVLAGEPGDDWPAAGGDSPACVEPLGEGLVGVLVSADSVDRLELVCEGLNRLDDVLDHVRRDDWLELRVNEEAVPELVGDVWACEAAEVPRSCRERGQNY